MNWDVGYSSAFYGMIVNPDTWQDDERIEVVSGSISKGTTDLRQSADAVIDRSFSEETYVRFYLIAHQDAEVVREPLFTGLVVSPDRDIDGRRESHKVECYSVLKPCDDIYLARGWYAPASLSCDAIIKDLLSATPAPIEFAENTVVPELQTAIIAEDSETNLSMVDKILTAIGWVMTIDGDGVIHIEPPDNDVVYTYDNIDNDAIEPQLVIKRDWFNAPNVYRAISDDLVAVARDDSMDSPLSTVNRGREVWAQDNNVDLNDGQSISDYAIEALKKAQALVTTIEYKRRYNPNIDVGNVIQLHYPEQGIDGEWRSKSQNIEMSYGCQTSEEVEKYEH